MTYLDAVGAGRIAIAFDLAVLAQNASQDSGVLLLD